MKSYKKTFYILIGLSLIFSIGHHIDHMIRGNHVGFPITSEVNPFTFSLGFYPVIILGLFFFHKNKVGSLFWGILSLIGVVFVGLTHFGPLAVEPPSDILAPYNSLVWGGMALLWLIMFLGILVSICLFSFKVRLKAEKEKKRKLKY